MAKASVRLICSNCGQEFTATKGCNNRTEADNWEKYMSRIGGECKECYVAKKKAEKEAHIAEQAKVNSEMAQGCPLTLPELQGTEKQIKWASDLRNGVIAAMNNRKCKWDVLLQNTERDDIKPEFEKLMEPSAKWWIENRGSPIFGVRGIGW